MQQNNTMPKTAVIMPAYNSGATIEASVRSILNQTVSNLVLIVVNDGSTDDTAAVLERLRAKDERLIPMTVPNGGPAKARNLALDAVPEDAEYIMSVSYTHLDVYKRQDCSSRGSKRRSRR